MNRWFTDPSVIHVAAESQAGRILSDIGLGDAIVDDKTAVLHLPEVAGGYDSWDAVLPSHLEGPIYEKYKTAEEYTKQTLYNRETTNPGLWNGAYVMTGVQLGTQVTLEASAHWAPKAQIAKVVFSYRDNASALLQNLLTQDLAGMAEGETRRALLLTPKARIVSDVRVIRTGTGFLLETRDADGLAALLVRGDAAAVRQHAQDAHGLRSRERETSLGKALRRRVRPHGDCPGREVADRGLRPLLLL